MSAAISKITYLFIHSMIRMNKKIGKNKREQEQQQQKDSSCKKTTTYHLK